MNDDAMLLTLRERGRKRKICFVCDELTHPSLTLSTCSLNREGVAGVQ